MLIYVDEISERLIFTLDFIFRERGISYQLTNDWLFFEQASDLKFNYSNKYDQNILSIQPAEVLFEESIREYSVSKANFHQTECLCFEAVCDPISSIFYTLSRYEEYTCKFKDIHDRFPVGKSIFHRFGWTRKAMCDRWCEDLILFLESKLGQTLHAQEIPLALIPTFDIDNTFAFQWKDGIRKWGSLIRDKLKKDQLRIEARKAFENGSEKDPYDTFDQIKALKSCGFSTRIFWLLGDYGKYDKNISANDIRHQALIKEMANFGELGLHPSYQSNTSAVTLNNEKKQLEEITGRSIQSSRQHFLKLYFPATYSHLIACGFKEDYTMGFAEEVGFRAGTARSFYFFDLVKNQVTDFKIHPFVYMDGSLKDYLKLTPEQAKQTIADLYAEVKRYGGNFTFLWHNESIGDFGPWKGWKAVFEYTLNLESNAV